jgi:polygalacturonase
MYNIIDFGAVPNAKSLATSAIQRAIDTCHQNGGGRVTVPAGTYLTGSIFLKSHVELHVEKGATLLASTDLADYNADDAYVQNFSARSEEWLAKHLIMAIECEDVALTGLGIIDGAGDFFFEEPKFYPDHQWMTGYAWRNGISYARDKETLRPGQVVCFIESKDITVRDITVQNSPCWSLFFHGCESVSIQGVRVFNPSTFGNTDGIDVDCCRHVTVSDCIIDTGDDAIAIRCAATRLKQPRPCEFITVSNCILSSYACGIRIGVGTGIIRHVRVSGLTIENAGYAINYITSYASHGCAEIEDVNFSDISIYNVAFPLQIKGEVGSVQHVSAENIRAYTMGGIKLAATDTCRIADVRIRNFDLHLIPETEEPDERRLKIRGDALLYLCGVKDARLDGVRVHADDALLATWRDALVAENCENITAERCNLPKFN